MPTEIERKFLVAGDGWRSEVERKIPIRQGYLAVGPRRTVRVRIADHDSATLNIKGPTQGASRAEFEYEIPLGDALEIIEICRQPIIEKTRHVVSHESHSWEIDVFEGANQGLQLAEVELDAESEEVDLPEWVGREVTEDSRYFNAALVEEPYSTWPSEDR